MSKAQDVVTSVLVKGSAIREDALKKPKLLMKNINLEQMQLQELIHYTKDSVFQKNLMLGFSCK